jgi:hypothetical protein
MSPSVGGKGETGQRKTACEQRILDAPLQCTRGDGKDDAPMHQDTNGAEAITKIADKRREPPLRASHRTGVSKEKRPCTSPLSTATPLPMRFVEIPRHRFSSVGVSTSSSSRVSACEALPEAPCGDTKVTPDESATHTLTSTVFRLAPRHRVLFSTSSLSRPSSGPSHCRKRSAQTMSCTSKPMPTIGPMESPERRDGHTSVVSTPDNHATPGIERSLSSPSQSVDLAAFSMKGLSLQSPGVKRSVSNPPPPSSICSPTRQFPPFGIPEVSTIDHPAATPTSFAGTASCFSKVVASPSSETVESSLRRHPDTSSGPMSDKRSTSRHPHEFRSSPVAEMATSPKIVPLTILTHASLTRTPSADSKILPAATAWLLNSTDTTSTKKQRDEFLRHATGAAGMSPFMLSLNVNSTPSTDGCPGSDSKASASSELGYYSTCAMDTPNPPPLPSVHLFYPDSNVSATSMISFPGSAATASVQSSPRSRHWNAHDSPSKRSVWSRSTAPASTGKNRVPVPKTSLTPRGSTGRAVPLPILPRFPSPTEDLQGNDATSKDSEVLGPIALPPRRATRSSDESFPLGPLPPLLDVSLLSEPDLNDSCSLDLSADASSYVPTSRGTASSEFAAMQTVHESYIPFPSWGAYPPRLSRSAADPDSNTQESLMLPFVQELVSTEGMISSTRDEGRTKCALFADDESLSDGEDDEKFVLAVPSTLDESLQKQSELVPRLAKHPRLHVGSMTSMASNTSLFGIGFANSSNNLHAMSEQLHPSHSTMRREQSSNSVGLDLEPAVHEDANNSFPSSRDLVTPPVMEQPQSPPALTHLRGNTTAEEVCDSSQLHNNPFLSVDFSKQAVG